MKLSIVTTMYHSESYLEKFHALVISVARKITEDYEVIFVNDGSPDKSLDIAKSISERDVHVKVIDLSRNFGHHKAMMTGLMNSGGDLIFLIDSDLEEDPYMLATFYARLQETGADVVYGVNQFRNGSWFERVSGDLFYMVFNWLSSYSIPRNLITARLMTRRYVEALISHQDQEIFMAGLWAITGFEQIPIEVNKASKGKTTYNLTRKIAILVNSITSFSNRPLVLIFYLGVFISFLSFLWLAYLLLRKLLFGEYLTGWPSLIASVWLLGGLTIFSLGIIGVYISKIFTEVKRRPYTVIRHIYQKDENK